MFLLTSVTRRSGFAMLRAAYTEGQKARGAPFIAVITPQGPFSLRFAEAGRVKKTRSFPWQQGEIMGRKHGERAKQKNPNNFIPLHKFLLNLGLEPFQMQRFFKACSSGGIWKAIKSKNRRVGKKSPFWKWAIILGGQGKPNQLLSMGEEPTTTTTGEEPPTKHWLHCS